MIAGYLNLLTVNDQYVCLPTDRGKQAHSSASSGWLVNLSSWVKLHFQRYRGWIASGDLIIMEVI